MKFYCAFCFLVFVHSCGDKTTVNEAIVTNTSITNEKLFTPVYAVNNFEGSYVGNFDQGFITVVLNYINGKTVSGYNLHKGLRRSINGTLQPDANGYKFILKEPGDNPYDGTFECTIDTTKFRMEGMWNPFDISKTKAKKVSLLKQEKKPLNYDEDLGMWVPATGSYNSDTTLDFAPEGICEYKFYQKPGDSTSQLISVKGNYILNKDTVSIDWQKNTFTPSQKMKLVKRKKIVKEGEYAEQLLVGNGWKFVKFEGE